MEPMEHVREMLEQIREEGTMKIERVIRSSQGARVQLARGGVVMLCSNNYLGLADHPAVLEAAKRGIDQYGNGVASVRFICGTQEIHGELERAIARFLGKEAAILFSSCYAANEAIFQALLGPEDVIFSDELNHASIIDGIRLCKAQRQVYGHLDFAALARALEQTRDARLRVIVTDGVFSMEGDLAPLRELADLAESHEALLVVDDSHATGVLGPTGRGTAEELDCTRGVHVITGTLGKALGGASGGFIAGERDLVELMRQRGRPYLFSNSLPPAVVASGLAAIRLLEADSSLVDKLRRNTRALRGGLTRLGYSLRGERHPIIPVIVGDARRAVEAADALLEEGVYVVGFSYPVVPQGEARLRIQASACLEDGDITRALDAFDVVGKKFGLTNG